MKADRKILLAFLLNLFFSVFEAIGGLFTGSVAILSDALHDMGDALSIGISVLVIIGLYRGWSPVGNNNALGIQGRYFIPCALLGLL